MIHRGRGRAWAFRGARCPLHLQYFDAGMNASDEHTRSVEQWRALRRRAG
jgi:hypothetical protein